MLKHTHAIAHTYSSKWNFGFELCQSAAHGGWDFCNSSIYCEKNNPLSYSTFICSSPNAELSQ